MTKLKLRFMHIVLRYIWLKAPEEWLFNKEMCNLIDEVNDKLKELD